MEISLSLCVIKRLKTPEKQLITRSTELATSGAVFRSPLKWLKIKIKIVVVVALFSYYLKKIDR